MKNLLKRLALWLIKITGINLVEPYTLDHLKHMIHSVKTDYTKFKYKPFLVEIVVISDDTSPKNKLRFYTPILIDCPTKKDALDVVSNIQNSLALKNIGIKFHNEKNICELVPHDFSAKTKLQTAIGKAGNSQYFLEIDLLKGITTVKHVKLPVDIDARLGDRLPSAKISINEIDFEEKSTE